MRKALIVGINNYPNAELYGCINDASAFGNTLETNGGGFLTPVEKDTTQR